LTADPPLPGPPLRLAVLGDFDGLHTRRWTQFFADRGHEVHAISYYRPRTMLPGGVTMHLLSRVQGASAAAESASYAVLARNVLNRLPPSALRLVHALRYQRAGLKRTLQAVKPDVFHAHYVVEHGFYGALAGFHPYVISAWGSDLFVAPRSPLGNLIARFALSRADLVTGNDPQLVARAAALGVKRERLDTVRLGIDELFFNAPASANLDAPGSPLVVLSDRALEPLYNIDVVVRAISRLRERLPGIVLQVAGDGSLTPRLRALVADLGEEKTVQFLGQQEPLALRDALAAAHIYVSVPDTDSLALSTMEAMATGAFPIVSDLPSQDWIVHGVNGLRVPPRNVQALADAMYEALTNAELRKNAFGINRAKVEAEGRREKNLLRMERHFYRLAGRPVADEAAKKSTDPDG
jgi:glycosyltransferase involved in cell wall biosynthesis